MRNEDQPNEQTPNLSQEQLSRSIRHATVANRRRKISEAFDKTRGRVEREDGTIDYLNLRREMKESNVALSKKVALLRRFNTNRAQRLESRTSISYKKSISSEFKLKLIRFKQFVTTKIKRDLWKSHIKSIYKQYGSHTAYYFYLFRWFFYLNLFGSVINFFFLIVPQIHDDNIKKISLISGIRKDCLDSQQGFISDFIGLFTNNSILYYGHYTNSSFKEGMPYAYLAVNAVYLVFNLIFIAYKLGANYTKNYIIEQTTVKTPHKDFASKVFTRWEYTMSSSRSVELQKKQMLYDIQQKLRALEPKRRKGVVNAIDVMKIASIFLSLAAIVGICYCMFLAYKNYSKLTIFGDYFEILNYSYGIPLAVTLFMFVYNDILNQILKKILENQSNYSRKSPKYIQMLKKILLFVSIVASLSVIHLSKLIDRSHLKTTLMINSNGSDFTNETCTNITTQESCWENKFAQDIFSYLLAYLAFLVLSLILREWLPSLVTCKPKPFDSSRNAFDLIYIQLFCWLNALYSPFAPIFTCIIFVVIFYVKRISIAVAHKPKIQKTKTINLSVWIYVWLLIGFIVCSLPPLYTIFNYDEPSKCGPFTVKNDTLERYYHIVTRLIDNLEEHHPELQAVIDSLLSRTSSVFIILILCVIVHYMRATSNARKHLVLLSDQQVTKNQKENQMLTRTLIRLRAINANRQSRNQSLDQQSADRLRHQFRRNSPFS